MLNYEPERKDYHRLPKTIRCRFLTVCHRFVPVFSRGGGSRVRAFFPFLLSFLFYFRGYISFFFLWFFLWFFLSSFFWGAFFFSFFFFPFFKSVQSVSLRHYYVSVLLSLGVPNKYAMRRTGHSSDAMLQRVYQHIMADRDAQIDEDINHFFRRKIDIGAQGSVHMF